MVKGGGVWPEAGHYDVEMTVAGLRCDLPAGLNNPPCSPEQHHNVRRRAVGPDTSGGLGSVEELVQEVVELGDNGLWDRILPQSGNTSPMACLE